MATIAPPVASFGPSAPPPVSTRAPDPAAIALRSQRSAFAEATPANEACAPCRGLVMVRGRYDDHWRTPLTMADLRVEDLNGVIFNGDISTQGLAHFGTRDGDVTVGGLAGLRPELGFVQAADAQRGLLAVQIIPNPADEAAAANLEQVILSDLRALSRTMHTAIQPWIDEWEARGVRGAFGRFVSGIREGLEGWFDGEGEFWSAIGEWVSNLPDMAADAWNGTTDAARRLWDNRQALLDLLASLARGDVNVFEQGLEALRPVFQFAIDGVGDMAALMGDVIDRSAEWAQGMHELVVRSNVLPVFAATALGFLAAIPPNFWSEVVGKGLGFLIPEAIIAILLSLLAAFTGGVGAGPLALRLTTFAAGIKRRLAFLGDAMSSFVRLLDGLADIVEKMKELIRRLMSSRRQRATGQTDVEIPMVRRVGRMERIDPGCFDALGYAARRAPGDPEAQREIVSEYARQLRDQQAGLNDLTIGEYLDARDAYNRLGRDGISDGAAQDAARRRLRGNIEGSVQESLENRGIASIQARTQARRRTREIMANLAALHDPDMIAGGADRIQRVGDSRVNSSIGGGWGSHQQPDSRISRIDAAAERAANDPSIGRDGRMNAKLEPCRGRSR